MFDPFEDLFHHSHVENGLFCENVREYLCHSDLFSHSYTMHAFSEGSYFPFCVLGLSNNVLILIGSGLLANVIVLD